MEDGRIPAAKAASIPTELEAAREALLDLIANAYEFSEDIDGEYDSEGRVSGTCTYTLRFDSLALEYLIEPLGIPQMFGESPKDAVEYAIWSPDGPGSVGSGQLSEVL